MSLHPAAVGVRTGAGMPDPVLVVGFAAAAAVSLGTSWLLVSRLERIGARLGLTEGLLGLLAALAADAPELTAAVTAMASHERGIGAGVVIGSNVFNLAALLGIGAVVAGAIALHRRVIVFEGVVALAVAVLCVLAVTDQISPGVGLLGVLTVLVPYAVALGVPPGRLRRRGLPERWAKWLAAAVHEEELELEGALDERPALTPDLVTAAAAVLVVVGASIAMEQAAATLGARHSVPEAVIGGLVLAGVTSLPNAVAAIYLAACGRGAATLSTAMNSNAINVGAGLLLPATLLGLGSTSGPATFIAVYYLALTAFVLGVAYMSSGLRRTHGVAIICGYLLFAGVLIAIA